MIIKITEWALKNRMGYMLSNVFRVIITSHHITWGLGRVGGGRSCGRGGGFLGSRLLSQTIFDHVSCSSTPFACGQWLRVSGQQVISFVRGCKRGCTSGCAIGYTRGYRIGNTEIERMYKKVYTAMLVVIWST